MKPTFVALAVAGFAAAQILDGVDDCVKTCIEQALPEVGCTGSVAEVAACACRTDTQAKLVAPVSQCAAAKKSCDLAKLAAAQSVASEKCKALASGSASGASSATGASSGSASGTSSGSATRASTAVISTVTTGTGGVPTNSRNQTATATSGATGTTKAPTSQRGSATTSGTGTVPTTTGAAAAGPVVGALAAVLAAALAL